MSIDAVMSRISEIQGQIDDISGTVSGERVLGTVRSSGSTSHASGTKTSTTDSAKTRSAAFTAALKQATGTTGGAATAAPATARTTSLPVGTTTPVTTTTTTTTAAGTTTTTTTTTAAGGSTPHTRTGTTSPVGTVTTTTTPATTGSGTLGSQAVKLARTYLGIPYKWGGTNPATGLDCSGLVQLVYSRLGVNLPRVAIDQAKAGTAVSSLSQAVPGDLIVFNGGDHIGIYIGGGKMIDAPHTGARVRVSNVAGYGSIYAIRHLGGSAATTSSSATTVPTAATGLAKYQSLFTAAEQKYHLPTGLLRAVAQVESGGNASAVSRAGAQGLMQIMPATARGLGVDPFSPTQAVDGAARLLADNLKTFGNLDLATAAYNAGAGAVRRYHGIPPYAETQAYVAKVRAAMNAGVA